MKTDVILDTQVARDVGSKVEKAEKPEVPKFVVDRYAIYLFLPFTYHLYLQCDAVGREKIFCQGEDLPPALESVLQPATPQ